MKHYWISVLPDPAISKNLKKCDMLLFGGEARFFSLPPLLFTVSCSQHPSSCSVVLGTKLKGGIKTFSAVWLGVCGECAVCTVHCASPCVPLPVHLAMVGGIGIGRNTSTSTTGVTPVLRQSAERAGMCALAGTLLAHAHTRAALTSTHIQVLWTQLHTRTHALRSGCRRHQPRIVAALCIAALHLR